MKVILGIFCGLVVLFAGGCAIMLVGFGFSGDEGAAPLALIPAAVAALNLVVLLTIWGKMRAQGWVFFVLAIVDLLAALGVALFWNTVSYQVKDLAVVAIPAMGLLLLKAALTLAVAQKLTAPPGSPPSPPASPPPQG